MPEFVDIGGNGPLRKERAILIDEVGQWDISLEYGFNNWWHVYRGSCEVNGELVHTFSLGDYIQSNIYDW